VLNINWDILSQTPTRDLMYVLVEAFLGFPQKIVVNSEL
jgi:hypothetical protein